MSEDLPQDWFYSNDRKQYGPCSLKEIVGLIKSKVILPETLIWHKNLGDWKKVGETELKKFFDVLPPPLPITGTSPLTALPQVVTNSSSRYPSVSENTQKEWYCSNSGRRLGPLTYGELTELIRHETLSPESFIWHPKLEGWKKVKETEFSRLLDILPPPPPPPVGVQPSFINSPPSALDSDRTVSFSLSLLFFWIKGHINVTHRDVQCKTANTILNLIPAGSLSQTIPLRNISAASVDSKFDIVSMIIGIILFLCSFSVGGLIFMFISAVIFLNGIKTALIIQRSGSDFVISVPFYEKKKIMKAQDAIREGLNYEADKVDLNIYRSR